jgi:CRP-like cAMP-binding protein
MALGQSSNVSLSENRILAGLQPADRDRLIARTMAKRFDLKEILYNAAGPMPYVYFPRSGVISSVTTMADGRAAEVAATGREGMVGVATALGADRSPEKVFCQIPSDTRRLETKTFVDEVRKGGQFYTLVLGYVRSALRLTAQHAACNCLHSVEERCAKWLLMSRDRAEHRHGRPHRPEQLRRLGRPGHVQLGPVRFGRLRRRRQHHPIRVRNPRQKLRQ